MVELNLILAPLGEGELLDGSTRLAKETLFLPVHFIFYVGHHDALSETL